MMTGFATGRTVLRAVSGLAIAGLLVYWFLQPVAFPLKALAFLLVSLSLANPPAGLLALAGLAPLSTLVAAWCGATGLGIPLLEVMALGVTAGAVIRSEPAVHTRLGAPALVMAAVALASAMSLIPSTAAPFTRTVFDGALLSGLLLRQSAQSSAVWMPLFDALIIAECAMVAWAIERTVRRSPAISQSLIAAALAGHAANSLISLQGLVAAATRTGDAVRMLPQLLMDVRFNVQMDLNAAASALLLAGVSGLGLLKSTGVKKAITVALLLLVGLGLWLTGSRIALVMAALGVIAVLGWPAMRTGRRRVLIAGAALVLLATTTWGVISSTSRRSTPVPRSVQLRLEMAKAGFEMFKEAPAFGIGVTRFYSQSTTHAGPYLLSVGWQPFENAHNNFVQVLAEQGLVGLVALLWALVVTIGGPPSPGDAAIRRTLIVGVVACIGTWLTGHPLLVPEFAFVFWFYCGILAALTPVAPHPARRRLAGVLVAALVLSVPLRATSVRNAFELEHYGIGLSLWRHDDLQRYRDAGRTFTLYLPANEQPTRIPVRRSPGAPAHLLVEVRLRGRLIDRVPVEGEAWQNLVVVVPAGAGRFEAVDFEVQAPDSPAATAGALLRVGKVVSPRRPI